MKMILPTNNYLQLLCLAISLLFIACDDDEGPDRPDLQVPDTYTSANYATNTITEAEVINELDGLVEALNNAEAENVDGPITYPSTLRSITATDYETKVDAWLAEIVKASGEDFDLENAPTGEGGILGTRLLDEHGLELEQMVEKGSFGAALYNHAWSVLTSPISPASVDQVVAIFGTGPDFDADEADFAANYAKRRSDNDAETGFFYAIRDNLIVARAAAEAGPEYQAELNNSLVNFLNLWELSNFATVIFYANTAKNQIQQAGDDPVALGNAMHAYAEAVGFTAGWRGLPAESRIITNEQIDQILTLLLAEDGEDPESYRFLQEPALLDNFDQIIDLIQGIYGFTEEQVGGFYVNN